MRLPQFLLLILSASMSPIVAGETLYNGIVLPDAWPPRRDIEALRRGEVMEVPYLKAPPEVVPIDLGRQLFVDDFLIAETTLRREFHKAEPFEGNPVMRPDKRWEMIYQTPKTAIAFSDGVWWDPQDLVFKMWYRAAPFGCTAYATSKDGLKWEKPALDVRPKTNIVLLSTQRDSSVVWLDHHASDPAQRWKFFQFNRDCYLGSVHTSADGIHWSEPVWCGNSGDRTTFFHNPFRQKWVFSIRDEIFKGPWDYNTKPVKPIGRGRRYWEGDDFIKTAQWPTFTHSEAAKPGQPAHWIACDALDSPGIPEGAMKSELYNLDATPYESLMLGLFSVLHGNAAAGRPKVNDIMLGFSRDGFHWHRPLREAVISVSDDVKAWNAGNVQSVGGGCCIVGDRLYFYHSGRNAGMDQTGVAFLRRDGFASMNADAEGGTLTTRPVTFTGRFPFVNVAANDGSMRVEILDIDGKVIAPFSKENSTPARIDSTRHRLAWTGAEDLSALSGKPVRFRFHLTSGKLYAFWASQHEQGHSSGYIAAGGPGFTSDRDVP
jgi:hypothetical protein